MKYVPKYEDVIISTVTTANKNIQGYFMKSDQSYYNLQQKPLENEFIFDLFIVVDEKYIQIEDMVIEIDIYKNCTYDIKKYKTYNRCQDEIYRIFYKSINSIIDKIKNNINSTELNSIDKIEINQISNTKTTNNSITSSSSKITNSSSTSTRFINNITNIKELKIKNIPKISDFRVHLIFNDFFARSDIISLIDVLITQLGMKEIIILPLSLSLAFNLKQKYCSFIFKNGFSFIDDFVLAEAYSIYPREKFILDYEDFVEGFSKLRQLDDSLKYSCNECEFKESSEDKIIIHLKKDHQNGNYSIYTKGNNISEMFQNRVQYLFSKEKLEKIIEKKFCIDLDFENAERLENIYEKAIKGASLFTSLKCSKDCWMTSYEWCNFRLRSLKEKLLFFI